MLRILVYLKVFASFEYTHHHVFLLNYLHTISPATKVLPSRGSAPVVFICDDMEDYACKYDKIHDLFNEHIAACYAKIWDIKVPLHSWVVANSVHVSNLGIPKHRFKKTMFGSHYNQYAPDLNSFFSTVNNSEIRKIINREDILKIGLFDIWLSNEDRTPMHSNLILAPDNTDNYLITAIDHVNIFNSHHLMHPLYQINEHDSIINSDITKALIKKSEATEIIKLLEKNLYFWINKCKSETDSILKVLPADWQIDIAAKKSLLMDTIFNEKWIGESRDNFRYISNLSF